MEDNENDPIVISAIIGTYLVERILVDNESVVEVLMWAAFKGIGLDESQLRPAGSIYYSPNQSIRAKGLMILLVTLV